MATEIYLGYPPQHLIDWIKNHLQPVTHEETRYKYAGDTEWRTKMLSGTIALVDNSGTSTGQIDNPKDIVAIEIGTGTSANPITSIGKSAFSQCINLTSVMIPDSVISIEDYAFSGCSDLMSVMIGNGVTSIDDGAFEDCYSLTSMTIPNNLTSIGTDAFYNCSGIINVTIGNNVTNIGDSAFYNCRGLTNVTIPSSVISIGNGAFANCSSLMSVTIDCFDVSTTKGQITNNYIFGDAFYDPETWEPIEKTFLVTCTDGVFNVTFGTDYSITFTDI